MKNLDKLIEVFKEFREELNKNMNMSYAPGQNKPSPITGTSGGQGGMYRSEDAKKAIAPMDEVAMSETLKMDKNGQWKLDKVDPKENVNIAHPQGKAKMASGVNKADGTNRTADPHEKDVHDGRGNVHMVKEEGTNAKAATSKPHNKGKFKVEDPVKEKSVEHAKAKGLPYNGEDKKIHKADKVLVGTGTNDENSAPGKHNGFGY